MTHAQQPVQNYTTQGGLKVAGRTVTHPREGVLDDDDPRAKRARMDRDAFARAERHPRDRVR